MNVLEKIKKFVAARSPHAQLEEERYPSGSTWLNVRLPNKVIVINHRRTADFHVSTLTADSNAYGDGPQKHFSSIAALQRHLARELPRASRSKKSTRKVA